MGAAARRAPELARLSLLPGSTLLAPLVWSPKGAWERLNQLAHVADGWSAQRNKGRKDRVSQPITDAMIEACGMIRSPRKTLVRCPTCQQAVQRLMAMESDRRIAWRCLRCGPKLPVIEGEIGDVAFVYWIGLRGMSLRRHQKHLAQRLHEVVRSGRTPTDAYSLAAGGLLIQADSRWPKFPPHSPRLGRPSCRLTEPFGPVWKRLAPMLVETVAEVRVHPASYLGWRLSQ
jgi:hypothetical protein